MAVPAARAAELPNCSVLPFRLTALLVTSTVPLNVLVPAICNVSPPSWVSEPLPERAFISGELPLISNTSEPLSATGPVPSVPPPSLLPTCTVPALMVVPPL